MPDLNTALSILGAASAPPPGIMAGSSAASGAAPVSDIDQRLAILQQGAAGKLRSSSGANPNAPYGSPASAFTSDPNQPGSELRPQSAISADASGPDDGSSPNAWERVANFGAGSNEGIAATLGTPVD